MTAPAALAEVWRGQVLEAVLRGHVAVVDASGRVLASAGDPEVVTTVRSTVKPLQALPFVDGGAADALGASAEEVAVACASHEGEPRHVEVVRRLLGRAGLDETALGCGPQLPYSAEAAWRLAASGQRPGAIHNNCSGKHAGMLAACVHAGWPVDGYTERDHPLQRDVAARMSHLAGVDLTGQPWGVDGCGLPTYGLPLSRLAVAFAAAATAGGAFRRCQDAMAAEPFMVGGTGRFDTALLGAAGDRLTAKSGGGAVWVAVTRPPATAVAVKLESGLGGSVAPVAVAALQALDLLPADLPDALAPFAAPPLTNWAGTVVGATRATLRLGRTGGG